MRIAKTVVAASISLMALCAQAGIDPATLPLETLSADVVVVGAGGTGMAAAAAAAEKGAKVIVFEKMSMIGGSSAFAGGAIAGGRPTSRKRKASPMRPPKASSRSGSTTRSAASPAVTPPSRIRSLLIGWGMNLRQPSIGSKRTSGINMRRPVPSATAVRVTRTRP